MTRVLHIARYGTVPIERRVMEMAAHPDFAFSLVRPPRSHGPADAHLIRDPSLIEHVRLVRIWNRDDPHRGLFQTVSFGMRAVSPDIVHAEEEPDSLAALHIATAQRLFAPRARLVLNTWQNVNRRKRRRVRWVLRRTLAAADAVVCGNEDAATLLRQMGYERPAPVIPALALDASIFHRRRVPRFDLAFTVGYVGRLAPEKGLDTLLRAVAMIGPPTVLAIAGSGPSHPGLEALAGELGIGASVRFVGSLDEDGVAGFLSAVDAVAVPSRRSPVWKEQFCRVAIEAMGCETPIVASDSGALPEVVGDAGLLFPEDDHQTLAEQLRRLRASPGLRAELARRGLERGLGVHGPALRAARTLEFYRLLLNQGASAR